MTAAREAAGGRAGEAPEATGTVLVVGATGQLGTAVVRRLAAGGRRVRALVRRASAFDHLRSDDVELAFGDLRDPDSLRRACSEVACVVSTATVVFPRGSYSFESDEGEGYEHLVAACRAEGVEQVVFVSNLAPYVSPYVDEVPTLRFKLEVEELLRRSGLAYTIVRSAPFMDDWLALIGSDLPLRGAEAASLDRFWLNRLSIRAQGKLVERRGVALVPGMPRARHAFVAVDDVAAVLAAAAGHPDARRRSFELGGPRAVSWEEVCEAYGSVLGRAVRPIPSLPSQYRASARMLRRISPAAANQMGLMWMLAENETIPASDEALRLFGVSPRSVEEFLREKAALPEGVRAA